MYFFSALTKMSGVEIKNNVRDGCFDSKDTSTPLARSRLHNIYCPIPNENHLILSKRPRSCFNKLFQVFL